MVILVKLLLAHICGDFILQKASLVKAKEENKLASYHLYVHSLLHGLLVLLFVWDIYAWKWALLTAFLHLIIDAFKLLVQNDKTKRGFFFIDQLLHLVSIVFVWLWWEGKPLYFDRLLNDQGLMLLTAVLVLTSPSSIAIRIFISKWSPHTEDNSSESLQSAGKYIGILERLFVFSFVVSGHPEAIGFLIAAKSVFRFGDLKDSKDRKLTEYILIGTLVSFGVAMLVGSLYKHFTETYVLLDLPVI